MGFDKSSALNRRNTVKALMMIYDAVAVNAAYFLALILRFYVKFEFNSGAARFIPMVWQFAPFYAIASVLIFYAFRLYHIMWQYGDFRDLGRIFLACVATAIVQVAGTMIFLERMPLTYYVLGPMIQFVLIAMSRFAYKFYLMERNQRDVQKNATVNVMIVGVDAIGQFARKQVEEKGSMRTVCMVDSQDKEPNRYMNGLPVIGGTHMLEDVLTKKKIGRVVIADQRLSAEQSKAIKELCERKGIEVEDLIEYLQNNNDSYTPVALNPSAGGARVIPFSPPDISDKEIAEVKKALTSGWITTGPRTKELEKKLAAYCHTSKVVCLNSATAAEELNFRVCGIGEGDEVIVPASCVMTHEENRLEKQRKTAIITFDADKRITSYEEKPQQPKGNHAVPPFYLYRACDVARIPEALASGCGYDAPGSFAAWLSSQVPVYAYEMPGKRYDIGDAKSYAQVQEDYHGITVK